MPECCSNISTFYVCCSPQWQAAGHPRDGRGAAGSGSGKGMTPSYKPSHYQYISFYIIIYVFSTCVKSIHVFPTARIFTPGSTLLRMLANITQSSSHIKIHLLTFTVQLNSTHIPASLSWHLLMSAIVSSTLFSASYTFNPLFHIVRFHFLFYILFVYLFIYFCFD